MSCVKAFNISHLQVTAVTTQLLWESIFQRELDSYTIVLQEGDSALMIALSKEDLYETLPDENVDELKPNVNKGLHVHRVLYTCNMVYCAQC